MTKSWIHHDVTVADLKAAIADLPDDMPVFVLRTDYDWTHWASAESCDVDEEPEVTGRWPDLKSVKLKVLKIR